MSGAAYDEFGNYIGPPLSSSESESDGDVSLTTDSNEMDIDTQRIGDSSEVVLFEDKRFYDDAETVYKGVETIVQEEDTQPLTQPIIAPAVELSSELSESVPPCLTYPLEFLGTLMEKPVLMRNIAIGGSFHSGKTSFVDELVSATRSGADKSEFVFNYTDNKVDEREREMSTRSTPLSLVLPNGTTGKHYLLNVIDVPGHPDFLDEWISSCRAVDGAVLVVDALVGIDPHFTRLLKAALTENLDLILVIAKIDRLILEQRLPPEDAYAKLSLIVSEANKILKQEQGSNSNSQVFNPIKGNVVFSSSRLGTTFTVPSFARLHISMSGESRVSAEELTKCLWGSTVWDGKNFSRSGMGNFHPPAFVSFILEPLYKICSRVVAEDHSIAETVGIKISKKEWSTAGVWQLLRKVFGGFFGAHIKDISKSSAIPGVRAGAGVGVENFVEAVVDGIADPEIGGKRKIVKLGFSSDEGLIAIVTRCLPRPGAPTFLNSLVRVLTGTLKTGDRVFVVGEDVSEERVLSKIGRLTSPQGRWGVEVSHASTGNLLLVEGLADLIIKTGIISSGNMTVKSPRLLYPTEPMMRVSVEPFSPQDLPKLTAAIRSAERLYPSMKTRIEESGEIVIFGSGEVYMDSVLREFRGPDGGLELRISEPAVLFNETVASKGARTEVLCEIGSRDNRSRRRVILGMVAEPLEVALLNKASNDVPDSAHLTDAGWDKLAMRNIWKWSPGNTSVLINDTLPSETDRQLLNDVKDGVIQGWLWAVREGVLLEEAIRGVKFRIIDVCSHDTSIDEVVPLLIPGVRKLTHAAILTASPRLLEPMLSFWVECPPDCVAAVYALTQKRRGQVSKDYPLPGTPLFIVEGRLPLLDSFGFQVDIRTHTQGMAFAQLAAEGWAEVPGDPLDDEFVSLAPLTAAPVGGLARDVYIKGRKRRGLPL